MGDLYAGKVLVAKVLKVLKQGLGDVLHGEVQLGALKGPGPNVVTKNLMTPAVCQCTAIPWAGGA